MKTTIQEIYSQLASWRIKFDTNKGVFYVEEATCDQNQERSNYREIGCWKNWWDAKDHVSLQCRRLEESK
jgi:hypothetical protein